MDMQAYREGDKCVSKHRYVFDMCTYAHTHVFYFKLYKSKHVFTSNHLHSLTIKHKYFSCYQEQSKKQSGLFLTPSLGLPGGV